MIRERLAAALTSEAGFMLLITRSLGLRMVGMALGFALGVLLARGLGPQGYGVYGVAVSVLALLMVPTEAGIPQLVTREVSVARAKANGGAVLSGILVWSNKVIFINFAAIAVAVAAWFLFWPGAQRSAISVAVLTGLPLVPLVAISNTYSGALRGLNRVLSGQLSELIIRPAFVVLVAGSLIALGVPLASSDAIALTALGALMGAIFARWAIQADWRASAKSIEVIDCHDWGRKTIPIALSEGMRVLAGHSAVLILAISAAPSEVGIYRVAAGIWAVATLPSTLVYVTCAPLLAARYAENSFSELRSLSAWIVGLLLMGAILMLIPFVVAGEWLVGAVFGAAYKDAASVVLILLVGELICSMLGHSPTVLNMLKRERAAMWFSGYGFAAGAMLTYYLAPMYGPEGAAIGAALGQITWRFLGCVYAAKRLSLNISILAWLGSDQPRKNTN